MTTREHPDRRKVLGALAGLSLVSMPAVAQPLDKIKVGVFPISSSLPYFVARDLGYFKKLGLDPETLVLMGGPANVAALITNQIEAAAVMVTLEGLNANVKKPGVAMYIAMHSQNKKYIMEQFVVRTALADKVKTLKDFKGLKLMSAPGPANINTAKGILAKVGLKAEKDYTIDQLGMGEHVNAMKSGVFDGGYTLEPSATIMHKLGVAKTVEAGVIATYILGDPNADAFAAGCVLTTNFLDKRPEVAKRFAQGWAEAIEYIKSNRFDAQKHLAKNTLTPANLVEEVPPLGYIMTKDMSPKQLGYLQKFADFGVQIGVVPHQIDVKQDLKFL
jgi:NitT/TauT family transport system substrate-binding protein